MRSANKILVGKPEVKGPLGGPRSRWEENGSYGNRVASCGLDASGSGKGPLAGSYDKDNGPSGSIKDGEFLD